MDNSYHKLWNVYQHSLSQIPFVHFVSELPDFSLDDENADSHNYDNLKKLISLVS